MTSLTKPGVISSAPDARNDYPVRNEPCRL